MDIWNNKQVLDITGNISIKEKKDEALCNEVYFVNAENGKFILKIAHDKIRQNELEKEYRIITELKDNIKLPQIYLYVKEKDCSFFVMQYIEGLKPKSFPDEILEQMAKTLNKIHKTKKTNGCVNFDNLLNIAEQNMVKNRLDLDEFVREDKIYEPKQVLEYLRNNKPQVNACLLHGDYRPKNIIINNNDLYILDWGLSFVGDPYYDLAIIKLYFTDDEFAKFIKYYGIEKLDDERLKYNEWLSAFLNV